MSNKFVLKLSCQDKVGIVAAVTSFLAQHDCMILHSSQHGEEESMTFFMRVAFASSGRFQSMDDFKEKFTTISDKFGMNWTLADADYRPKVVVLVSKQSHCLADLLYRWHSGDLACEIPCVISNHQDMASYVDWHEIPYHHVPVEKETKDKDFDQIDQLIEQYQADVVVLARYMQIIPPAFCKKYAGKVINIHHSFLPAFIGADPYRKAFDKGVKLVGATCHYVTEDLDEGPIIEQDVIRISHRYSTDEIRRLGKDVEKAVLARGLRYHIENKVIVHQGKTIIFD